MRALTHISLILGFWLLLPIAVNSQIIWEEITVPDSITISGFSFEITPDNNIYFGCEPNNGFGGVYKSSNNGNSWDTIGLTYDGVYGLALDTAQCLLACTLEGIFKLNETGTWEHISDQKFKKLKAISGVLYASTMTEFVHSTDNGYNWEILLETDSGGEYFTDFTALGIDTVFVSGKDYLGGGGGVHVN